jgi:hypothetical protein
MAEVGVGSTALSLALGLGLSAACGFRVFVPLLVMNLAARGGYLELAHGFDWIASTPALVAFGVATVLEIGAYYIPWLDHALDTIATPTAIVAGMVVTASVVSGMDPLLRWGLALIAGGGLAGAVQALTAGTRGASTWLTLGMGNPILASTEAVGATALSLLALAAPLLALVTVLLFLLLAVRLLRRLSRRRSASV